MGNSLGGFKGGKGNFYIAPQARGKHGYCSCLFTQTRGQPAPALVINIVNRLVDAPIPCRFEHQHIKRIGAH